MYSILLISDNGVSTGFGRIADNIGIRLTQRGLNVVAASFAYDGLLPPTMDGQRLPYHVATLQIKRGMGTWLEDVVSLVNATQPDIIMVCQDAPYGEQVRNANIDWSQHKFVMITPVDGVPIEPNWVKVMKEADGALTISEFGVNAFRDAGVQVGLCRPGIAPNDFFELSPQQKTELRAKLGVPQDAFILGTMAQNQGRKAIPLMLEGFFEFAKDKNALYLLDMDEASPVGWNIKHTCQQHNWDVSKLIFRSDCLRLGITELRDRYNLLDAHAVLAHREGYGLPLVEAQACGVVSVAMDTRS
jgi:glycosyltransferase involved in cell wall biosynthesis